MTTANLIPLAPKPEMITKPNTALNNLNTKPMSASLPPLVAPQSLLLYPDVLMRASIRESLLQGQAQGLVAAAAALSTPALPAPANPLLSNTVAYANTTATLQQQLQLELQKIQKAVPVSNTVSPAPPPKALAPPLKASKTDIIGMGICIPKPPSPRATNQAKVKKIMMHGKPLQAPPPLCKNMIYKKRSTVVSAPAPKRRKIQEPAPTHKKALSTDELEFLQAAQRLHDIQSASKTTPKTSPPPPLTSKALRPPPALGL